MDTRTTDFWIELAYDPAAQQRLAEAARNEALGSMWNALRGKRENESDETEVCA
ncbi:MAG: hypothetical protein AAF458_20055 [Pseudomonadota bacterium]